MTDQSSISENDTAVASAAVEPWYKKGLNFKCTECGQCCTGGPGFVWVTEEEIAAMADLLQISVKDFKIKYVRKRGKRQSLNERKSDNFACVFLKDKKCLVYKARPEQCRTFPWWKENLESEESWKLAASTCEGIHNEAPVVPYSQIVQFGKL
ncbi:MAG TPA: YkgJ family cysteine cluster protein [Chlamydiales bacterium]|nr:YkgJ family cysteine cluster protein [Chlamydiales bacterium]